ncbi:hypothetical protein ACFCYB_27430 [Streptomyces sp. NPDC056309]|uniref:hypothetical protein n=1 Tax=unclassified Streptomyces TaxID=2593676 RepID=UPI0035DCDEBF
MRGGGDDNAAGVLAVVRGGVGSPLQRGQVTGAEDVGVAAPTEAATSTVRRRPAASVAIWLRT